GDGAIHPSQPATIGDDLLWINAYRAGDEICMSGCCAFPRHKQADFVGQPINSRKGKRVGDQCASRCNSQIWTKDDGRNDGKDDLTKRDQETEEHANGCTSGGSVTLKPPQTSVMEMFTERGKP